jgi:phosphonate transport system permease protein
MADIAITPPSAGQTDLGARTASYIAATRRKQMYSGILLLIFVLMMMSGFRIAEERNAGDFLPASASSFPFPPKSFPKAGRTAPTFRAILPSSSRRWSKPSTLRPYPP